MADLEQCRKILGIRLGAGADEIKQAYRDLVKIWHPDRFYGDIRLLERAQEQLKHINAAYRTLIKDNPGRNRAESASHNGMNASQETVQYQVHRRFPILLRFAVCLLILACASFGLSLVRSDLAEVSYNLGSAYIESGHCEEALTALKIACWFNPRSDKMYYALGNTYFHATLYAEAEEAYNKVIGINPHHEGAQRQLALLRVNRPSHKMRSPDKGYNGSASQVDRI